MKRETIYKIQNPVSEETNSTTAEPGDDFGDKMLEFIEDATGGVCDVIYGACDVINNLALDITIAGATLAGAEDWAVNVLEQIADGLEDLATAI